MKSSLWKIPEEQDTDILLICNLDVQEYGGDIKISTFHLNDRSQIAIVVDNKVVIWRR
ncbi:hypothetical protein PGB90_005608 [Kerria lacca]